MPAILSNPGILSTAERNRNYLTAFGNHSDASVVNDEQAAAKALATALYFAISGTICSIFVLINEASRHESFKVVSEASTTNTSALTNAKWRGMASTVLISISLIATLISIHYYFVGEDLENKAARRNAPPTEHTPLLPSADIV